jgi:hypothetical protein
VTNYPSHETVAFTGMNMTRKIFCPAFFCQIAEIMINDGIETVIRELRAPSLGRLERTCSTITRIYRNGALQFVFLLSRFAVAIIRNILSLDAVYALA